MNPTWWHSTPRRVRGSLFSLPLCALETHPKWKPCHSFPSLHICPPKGGHFWSIIRCFWKTGGLGKDREETARSLLLHLFIGFKQWILDHLCSGGNIKNDRWRDSAQTVLKHWNLLCQLPPLATATTTEISAFLEMFRSSLACQTYILHFSPPLFTCSHPKIP